MDLFNAPTRYVLRDYQEATVFNVLRDWNDVRGYNPIVVAPTGAGKSLIIASIVDRLKKPVIVFQPSREILVQNMEKLRAYGYNPAVWSASLNRKRVSGITLATIGSVVRHAERFAHFKYVIIDECDGVNPKGGMYEEFIRKNQPKVMGLTATPYRLSVDGFGGPINKFLTRTNPRIFNHVSHAIQIQELLDQGFLCPLKYFHVNAIVREKIKLNSSGSDFDQEDMERYVKTINMGEKLRRVVERLLEVGKKSILVFTTSVQEAHDLARKLPEQVSVVSAETKNADRDVTIKAFKEGLLPVVANVGVLTAGFDHPGLEAVVIARATKSLRLYYQMAGRAFRPSPGKKEAWIVDMGGNVKFFGELEGMRVLQRENKWQVEISGRPMTNVYFVNNLYSDGRPLPEHLKFPQR